MPLYIKDHSQGEFIFDWSWADAYYRNGLNYYPKLVSSIPFTPATGPRLLLKNPDMYQEAAQVIKKKLVVKITKISAIIKKIEIERKIGFIRKLSISWPTVN